MLLLALDTATPAVTVALHDGTAAVAVHAQVDARRHGELLLPAVDRVLAEAGARLGDVTDLAVGVGPGPYTGLRVGLMTADTFGFTLGVPVHGVCTLDALAYAYGAPGADADAGAGADGPFAVATDARRKEVYWARYADARTRVEGPAVARPAELAPRLAGLPVTGEGAFLYPDAFPDAREPRHVCAAAMAGYAARRLAAGEGLPAGGVRTAGRADQAGEAARVPAGLLPPRPLYLRRPDAQVPKNYKVVTPR